MPHFNPLHPPEDGLPPAEVRVTSLSIEPWPDGRRIKVLVGLTPFLERPNLNATIQDAQGEEVSSAVIVETMDDQMVFTMHIRAEDVRGVYTLTLSVAYPDLEEVDRRTAEFTL